MELSIKDPARTVNRDDVPRIVRHRVNGAIGSLLLAFSAHEYEDKLVFVPLVERDGVMQRSFCILVNNNTTIRSEFEPLPEDLEITIKNKSNLL